MTELNSKHPNYNNELLIEGQDVFRPEFKRDTRGRYFMQLPGYGKWMVGVEPGSKIISQGSEDEGGGPATDFGSIRTGTLNVDTVLYIGDKISMDGSSGCINVGDYIKRVGTSISMCPNGLFGYSGTDVRFGFWLEAQSPMGQGDFLLGDWNGDEYVHWDNSEAKLSIHGDLVIAGDLQSDDFVTGVSGWRLGYYDNTAEFQDVWVRGKITMEAGSSGDASYIDETVSRRWAAETGANITETRTSDNTAHVSFSTALDAATGADRGLYAINAFYRYGTWLNSSEMDSMGAEPGSTDAVVRMDNGGIYGWRTAADTPSGESRRTFWLDANTGDLMLRGIVYASAGLLGGWILDADRIWKEQGTGPYRKIELNMREGTGVAMHIQALSTNVSGNYSLASGVQITPGLSTSPDPRVDILNNGVVRVKLNKDGLHFFASDGVTIVNQILAGTGVGDVQFGGGVVRCWSSGVRISETKALAVEVASGDYMQIYGQGGDGIIQAPSSSTENVKFMNSTSTSNRLSITAYQVKTYVNLIPSSNGYTKLGDWDAHWSIAYTQQVENNSGYLNLKVGSGYSITFYCDSARSWINYNEFFHYGKISCYGGFVNGGKTFTSRWSATLGAEVLASGPVS